MNQADMQEVSVTSSENGPKVPVNATSKVEQIIGGSRSGATTSQQQGSLFKEVNDLRKVDAEDRTKARDRTSQPQGSLFKEVNDLRKVDAEDRTDAPSKYNDTLCGRIAVNKYFEGLTFFFITLNALYIGYDADYNARFYKPDDPYASDMPWGFIFMENLFAVYFTVEVVIRFIAFKRKIDCLCDGWFVFDFILVTFMVLETWIFPAFGLAGPLAQFSVLRLLRLLRISRMARLMKQCPELMIIIKGLIASFRSVGCTAVLLLLVLYIWSILFTTEYHEGAKTDDDIQDTIHYHFGTMGRSMFSLFIMGTILDDVTVTTDAIRQTKKNWFMLPLFIIFILISSFTILNMLIGILCEVVSATAEAEKTKAMESSVREAITKLFMKLDVDGSGHVSKEEFMKMRKDKTVRLALEEMEICTTHFQKYCEILFQETEDKPKPTIDFDTLIGMILRLRPGNHVSALDFSLLEASLDKSQEHIRERVLRIQSSINTLMNKPSKSNNSLLPPASIHSTGASNSVSIDNVSAVDASSTEARSTAKGEAPPGISVPPAYTPEMFIKISSRQIVNELERRLGAGSLPRPSN